MGPMANKEVRGEEHLTTDLLTNASDAVDVTCKQANGPDAGGASPGPFISSPGARNTRKSARRPSRVTLVGCPGQAGRVWTPVLEAVVTGTTTGQRHLAHLGPAGQLLNDERRLNDLSFGLATGHGGLIARAPRGRGPCQWPSITRPAVVTVWATAVQLKTGRAVPMGLAVGGGRADAGALDRITGVLPVSESAFVTVDVAVPVSLEGTERGACVLTGITRGVEDDLVVAAQRLQRAARAGKAQRARDVLGPKGPTANRHDQLDGLAGIELRFELLSADRVHRSLLSVGMTYTG
jgi:hypothetical protein